MSRLTLGVGSRSDTGCVAVLASRDRRASTPVEEGEVGSCGQLSPRGFRGMAVRAPGSCSSRVTASTTAAGRTGHCDQRAQLRTCPRVVNVLLHRKHCHTLRSPSKELRCGPRSPHTGQSRRSQRTPCSSELIRDTAVPPPHRADPLSGDPHRQGDDPTLPDRESVGQRRMSPVIARHLCAGGLPPTTCGPTAIGDQALPQRAPSKGSQTSAGPRVGNPGLGDGRHGCRNRR